VESVEGSRVVTKAGTASAASLLRCCELLSIDAKALCHCLTYRELQTMAPGKESFGPCLLFCVLYLVLLSARWCNLRCPRI
jgi:hypothetical protein